MVSILSYLFGFTCLVWYGRAGLPVALPDVFLACLLPFALRNWLQRKVEVHLWLNRAYYLVLLGLCWATVSCAAAMGLGGGLLKACQLGWYLLAGPFVVAMLPEERGRMMKGLAIGLVVNAITACVMPFWGTIGGPCGGLMLSRTGFGVGMAIALSLLLLRDALPLAWVTAPWGSVALMLCGLSLSGLSGIVLCCLAIAMSYRNGFIIRERQLHLAPFLAAVLLMLLISPARRAALVDCVTPSETTELSEASPRRWVQERICAWRATKASPWFGYGPGQYQATVGMARFRGRFPRPNETKVELNTQDGWQVVSVEYGFTAALLIAAGFIILALNSLRRKDVIPDAARIGFFLFLGMFFTPLLVKGAGMLVALTLGVMLQAKQQAAVAAVEEKSEASDDTKVAPSHTCWATGLNKLGISWSLLRQPLPLFALWAASLVLMAAAHRVGVLSPSNEEETGKAELASGSFASIVEAETLLNIVKPFEIKEDDDSSGGRVVEIPDRVLEDDATLRQVRVTYPLEIQEAKTLHLWMRARWKDGCGNSVYVSWDGATPSLAGNDGTYQAWHWIYGGDVNLTVGKHELALVPSEDGVEIDQLILCDDSQFRPRGVMDHESLANGKSLAENQLNGWQALLASPAPLAEPVKAEKPLLFGIAGPYRGGYEGMLIKYGMPFRRLMDYELEMPERLADCTCIMISEPMNRDFEKMTATLTKFVEDGGTLVLEKCDNWMATLRRPTPLYPRRVWWHTPPGGVLQADDSWPFAGLEPGTELTLAHDVAMQLMRSRDDGVWQPRGVQKVANQEIKGGIWERTLGKGRILYCSVPFSFQVMWRDRQFDVILKNILENIAATVGRKPLWNGWKAKTLVPSEPCFTDDFMRDGNEPGGGWKVLSGSFVCPGDKPPVPNGEFTLECKEPGEIAVGDDSWKNYSFSYSILGKGVTTLKLKTTAGRDVVVRYDGNSQTAYLEMGSFNANGGGNSMDGETERWHRIAVMCRNASVEVFCDGQSVLHTASGAVLLDDETFAGEAKLSFDTIGVLLDDVSVRSVDDILPETGRAVGEEGSCLSLARVQDDGIEPYTVFTPLVNGRPATDMSNGFTIPLPLFREAKLLVNGKPYVVPSSHPDNVWAIPESDVTEWFVPCSAWKDYVFKSRLTDWYGTGEGKWQSLERWSCDRNWSWLGVETNAPSILWHRQKLMAPFGIRTWVSMGARENFAAEYERGRDLNLVFGGNGKDLTEGWTVRVMRAEERGVELWHGDQLVAQNKDLGLGHGHTLHHSWYETIAVVEAGRVRVYYEGRLALDTVVDEKEFRGQVGIWTENNSIRLGRAQIAF